MSRAPTTIRDVAARAGCSIASVSRVATGAGPVSAGMRERILAAAAELGFAITPSRADARQVIAVLVPSVTNPVFAAALAGIEQCTRTKGYSTIIGQSNYDLATEDAAVRALIAERPMGMVVTVCDPATSEGLARIVREKLPVATIYNEPLTQSVGAILVDNRAAIRNITEELIRLDHRTIAFVAGRFASSDRAARRYQGYCDAMAAARLSSLAAIEVDFIDAATDIDLTRLMHQSRPTAIIVSNDLLAVTVMSSLRRMGINIPADVSVVGFDGIDFTRHLSPALTTIVQPSRTMGVLAASMVLDIAAGRRQPEHVSVATSVFHGETIAPPCRRDDGSFLPPHANRTVQS